MESVIVPNCVEWITFGALLAQFRYVERYESSSRGEKTMDSKKDAGRDFGTSDCYAASFLLSMLEGVDIPNEIGPGEFCDIEIAARDGWKVDVFYDCGELDYINHFISPKGEVVDFWDWPESEDKSLLINWRGH